MAKEGERLGHIAAMMLVLLILMESEVEAIKTFSAPGECPVLECQADPRHGIAAPEFMEVRGCFHCGTACRDEACNHGDKNFCCPGCLMVFELLMENGLGDFYKPGE